MTRHSFICYIKQMLDRFWDKVRKTDGCWEFAGAVSSAGYGTFWHSGKCYTAHRFAWLDTFGSLPPQDTFLCHSCDNKRCVRPSHIFLGSRADNARDMWSKGRQGPRFRKIPAKEHPDIVRRVASGELQRDVAKSYGVTQACISQIVRGVRG